MKKFTKVIISTIPAILFFIFLSFPAHAVYLKSGTNLILSQNEPLDESAFVAGESLVVDSNINGDLFCAGKDVTVNGNIAGDIICAGQTIKINGLVGGDIRIAAQSVEIDGITSRNVMVLSQTLKLGTKAIINGDLFFGAQQVNLSGELGRDMAGAGEQVTISGSLFRNALISASKIDISNSASIGGSLDYYMDETGSYIQNSPQSVTGLVNRHEIIDPEKDSSTTKAKDVSIFGSFFGNLLSIISYSLLACLLIYFTPKRTAHVISIIRTNGFKTLFLGLGVSIIAPFVFILLFVSVIGASSALVLIPLYIISMIIGSLYHSMLVGKYVVSKLNVISSKSLYLEAIVGCFVVGIIIMIPVIGWFVGLCLYLSGLGATLLSYIPEKK